MPRIRCLQAPLINRKENVKLWYEGDEADIRELTGYWRGMIERGIVELLPELPKAAQEPEPDPAQAASRKPSGRKPTMRLRK